jgi:hypothetical protein
MSQSFGIVEEKPREAGFFLDSLEASGCFSLEARFYFSAFISAARSITLALQATLDDADGFNAWYEQAQAGLKLDPLARYFVEIRNDSVHKGLNPLDRVTVEHLRESLLHQLRRTNPPHVIILPDAATGKGTTLADAVRASSEYFKSLVELIFDCYERFKCVVDPRWYFTSENFVAKGRTIEDALEELGFPRAWLPGAVSETEGWRVLRAQQPPCLINDIFLRYVGRTITDPDEAVGAVE